MNKKIYIITIICSFIITFILLYVLFYKKEHTNIKGETTKIQQIEQSGEPIYKKLDFEVKMDKVENLNDVKQDNNLKRN